MLKVNHNQQPRKDGPKCKQVVSNWAIFSRLLIVVEASGRRGPVGASCPFNTSPTQHLLQWIEGQPQSTAAKRWPKMQANTYWFSTCSANMSRRTGLRGKYSCPHTLGIGCFLSMRVEPLGGKRTEMVGACSTAGLFAHGPAAGRTSESIRCPTRNLWWKQQRHRVCS